MSFGDKIRYEFDKTFLTVKKKGVEVPFYADVILTALGDTGISPLHALDILYQIKPNLQTGISTKKIIKFLNEAILDLGYDENSFVKSETTIPIMITWKNERRELNFKVIKEIVREQLKNMRYTSKTFRDLIDELHRTIIALENWDLTVEEVNKLIPSALRNILGTNPFSNERCLEDYQRVHKLKLSIEKTWLALPTEERHYLILKYIDSAFRVILLSFNFLPGHVLNSTIIQLNNLITSLTSKGDITLSDHEIKKLADTANKISEISKDPLHESLLDFQNWQEDLDIISTICDGLINSNSILWIVGRDNIGRDLFTFSSKQHLERGGASTILISSALFGIETQLNEITKSKVRQLDQGDNAILIDKRVLFTLIVMVEKPISHLVRQKINELGNFIENNFENEILNFKGKVSVFQNGIRKYLIESYSKILKLE